VLDDHAAVRAGLEAILGAAPDMVSVGSAHGEAELLCHRDARERRVERPAAQQLERPLDPSRMRTRSDSTLRRS
jgi:hypothetical protein